MYSHGLGRPFGAPEEMKSKYGNSGSHSDHPWGEMREPSLGQYYAKNAEHQSVAERRFMSQASAQERPAANAR